MDVEPSTERVDPVGQSVQSGAGRGVRAPTAVVGDLDQQRAALALDTDLDRVRAGVPARVRQRLADEEVSGELDLLRQLVGADVDR